MNPERNENKENSENNLKCNRKEEKRNQNEDFMHGNSRLNGI